MCVDSSFSREIIFASAHGYQIIVISQGLADGRVESATRRFIAGPSPEEIDADIASRRAKLIEWSRYASGRDHPKYRPYDYLAFTARDGCGPPDWPAYMANLGAMGLAGQPEFEMFALPPLVRYLYMFGHCLSEAQRQFLVTGLAGTRRSLFAHGTLNHMIIQASSWYLLAQYFPNTTWTDADGTRYSSNQVMDRIKTLLAKRNWRFFQTGHYELLSPTYSLTNLFPLLNLVDFATDPEVVRRADAEASLEVMLLKAHSFHGVIMPPLTRRNVDQTNAPLPDKWPSFPAIGQHILWYYFGEPAADRYDFIQAQREPFYAIMLALSSWRPPLAAWWMPAEEYVVRYVTPDFSLWDEPAPPVAFGDTYIGRNYALATGNMIFDPLHYNTHNQTFAVAWRSGNRRNLLECQHPYWRSDNGEDAWLTDFWSPFVQTFRLDKHRAVLLASIPRADPWTEGVEERFWVERDGHKDALIQMVQCRIPREVDEFVLDGQWAFIRHGSTFVALGVLKGVPELADALPAALEAEFRVLKVREAKTALFVFVEDDGGSFENFRERAKAAAPSYDDTAPSVTASDARGRSVTVRFQTPSKNSERAGYWLALPEVSVNGVVRHCRDTPAFKTPFLKLAEGSLSLEGPGALKLTGAPQAVATRRVGEGSHHTSR
jgi:hypothetical protein